MIRRLYYKLRWCPSNIRNFINLHFRKVQFGGDLRILGAVFFRGKGRIQIGNNVRINSCLEANPIGGDRNTIFYVKEGGNLIIGNNVGISNSALYCEMQIQIDDDVLIGNSCKIYDSNFHSLVYEQRMNHKEVDITRKPVAIRKGAFIGAHTIVLKGVTIGENSIIGAGSVVTKNVPNREIWAGNPAKFVRKI